MRVIFVHGAVVTDSAWWWQRMRQPLGAHGFSSVAVELPSCSTSGGDLHADGDAVQAVLDESDEPAVLVGHSYGGMVITDAGAHPAVRHLVYVTAGLPETGQSLAALADPESPGWLEPTGDDDRLAVRADLSEEDFHVHFTADCDEDAARGARARLVPQSSAALAQPPRAVAWHSLPSTFVLCTHDQATAPAVQASWATRAGQLVEIPTGHHPFLSQPQRLADIIANAVAGDSHS
ncbi:MULTISPECIES: alpha/beta hydrolase [unclassified Actinopolyspora]|uniref:alpha/beta hydrolase n=1 Tax=unclassified Actinopolyspora TaxID=2639451 RepID=UPI0013F63E79|nr:MULTISPECIES: alpha/beta hydrolase [unclassified Actinopolyspora]NHD15647.1 alpha/beta hydrolase [Actinopolyspora sp. BKK2]NHE75139.1 alpha/beta hydrolase [Actinopolyspora sp. BKK1]